MAGESTLSRKYAAYPEYKASGVEWLDDVPSHWGTKPLKFMCTYNDEVLADSVSDDHEIEYVDIGSVSATTGITKTESMAFGKAPSRARRIVRDGDVIISTVRTYLEAIAPIDNPPENLVVSTGFAVIRPNKLLHKRYAAYCLRANGFIKEVVAQSVGISYPAINATDLVNIKAPEPAFEEQQKIANFLDHETTKIDTLIDKQQQLITLLKEKRQAVISHAVTKGLNPNAPMRDSGVEWLGEVPADWTLPKIKWFYQTESGGTPNTSKFEEYYQDGEIPWIRTTDLNNGDLYGTPVAITDKAVADSACSILPVNSVLVAMYGGAGTIGKHSLLKFESTINQAVCAILPIDKIYPEYMHLYVEFYRPFWMVGAEGTRKDPNINQEVVRELMVPCPPSDEQFDIVKVTKKKLTVIDEIVSKSENNIKLMQERRTALISAAVTGKIDVRNWQAPNVYAEVG